MSLWSNLFRAVLQGSLGFAAGSPSSWCGDILGKRPRIQGLWRTVAYWKTTLFASEVADKASNWPSFGTLQDVGSRSSSPRWRTIPLIIDLSSSGRRAPMEPKCPATGSSQQLIFLDWFRHCNTRARIHVTRYSYHYPRLYSCRVSGRHLLFCKFIWNSEVRLEWRQVQHITIWKIASSHMINIYCNWWFRHHHVRLPEAGGWEGKIRSYGCIMYPFVSIFPKKRVAKELREERGL